MDKRHRRYFLNRRDGMAAVELTISKAGAKFGRSISLDIRDCYRKIELDFSWMPGTADTINARLWKLGRLESALADIRETLEHDRDNPPPKSKGRKPKLAEVLDASS